MDEFACGVTRELLLGSFCGAKLDNGSEKELNPARFVASCAIDLSEGSNEGSVVDYNRVKDALIIDYNADFLEFFLPIFICVKYD